MYALRWLIIKDFREGGGWKNLPCSSSPPPADGKAPSDTGNCRAPERLTKPPSVLLNVRRWEGSTEEATTEITIGKEVRGKKEQDEVQHYVSKLENDVLAFLCVTFSQQKGNGWVEIHFIFAMAASDAVTMWFLCFRDLASFHYY